MPSFTEDLYRRYVGIHNLAERGSTPGERTAAGNARVKLEDKYPGLGMEALRWQEAQDRAARGEPPVPPPPPPKRETFSAYTASSGNWGGSESTPPPSTGAKPDATPWGSWGDVLGTAFKAAQGFTETVINAEAGRQYAEACVTMDETKTRTGVVRLTAAVPFADLITAKARLNDAQKQAFARSVGERVTARLYSFLAG